MRYERVLIEKADRKLREKLKSSRCAFSGGRIRSDVDRSPKVFNRKSARHDPPICGYEIGRIFEDSGRSGLRIDGRDGLQSLMRDVQSGTANFRAILVYDVSRWGRFQDADESAYHEHLCSRSGILVHYCG